MCTAFCWLVTDWGGDKAIKVANELQNILRKGEIITEAIEDVRPTSTAARNLKDFAANWETKLRVYLATEDAVDSQAKDGGPSKAKPNPGAVYDHFNVFESDDATFEKMPDALHGASFPELGKNNVDKTTTDNAGDDNGKHVAIPGLAQKDLFGWLGLPAPSN